MNANSPIPLVSRSISMESLRSEAWLLRGISSIPGELTLAQGVLQFVAHDTGSAWHWQLRKLERELCVPGLAEAIDSGDHACLFRWQAHAIRAWVPWYYFAGGIKLRHGGIVLSFSFGRPANMEVRIHSGGAGALAELRRQCHAIRQMRGCGKRWLAALVQAHPGRE